MFWKCRLRVAEVMRELHPDEERFTELVPDWKFVEDHVHSDAFELELERLRLVSPRPAPAIKRATVSELVLLEPIQKQGAHPVTIMAMLSFTRKHPGEAKAVITRLADVLRRRNATMNPRTRIDHADGDRGFTIIGS